MLLRQVVDFILELCEVHKVLGASSSDSAGDLPEVRENVFVDVLQRQGRFRPLGWRFHRQGRRPPPLSLRAVAQLRLAVVVGVVLSKQGVAQQVNRYLRV